MIESQILRKYEHAFEALQPHYIDRAEGCRHLDRAECRRLKRAGIHLVDEVRRLQAEVERLESEYDNVWPDTGDYA